MTDGAACLRLSVWDDIFTDKLVCPHAEEKFHHTTSCQASPLRGKLSLLLLMTLFDTVSMCIKRVGLPTNICTQQRRHFSSEFIRPWNLEWVILKVCGGETKQHILLCDPDLWCHRGWSESFRTVCVTIPMICTKPLLEHVDAISNLHMNVSCLSSSKVLRNGWWSFPL